MLGMILSWIYFLLMSPITTQDFQLQRKDKMLKKPFPLFIGFILQDAALRYGQCLERKDRHGINMPELNSGLAKYHLIILVSGEWHS